MSIKRFVAMGFIAVSASVFAQNAAPAPAVVPLRQMLESSKRRGQLEMGDTPPYRLKASYQLFSADGQPGETGTVDELWKGEHHYRLTITQPGGELVEIRNDDQHWRTGNGTIQNRKLCLP